MKAPISLESRALCEVRLGELNIVDVTNLTEFAERRLATSGMNPAGGEDVTQRALAAILRGMETDQGGRVPRLVDIENKSAFLNYVRGAISSIVNAMGRKRQVRIPHEPWGDNLRVSTDRVATTPARLVELSDLKSQLFSRLRVRAPRRLKRTIDAWESVFTESDRIPAPGHRRYVGEVKALAQEIVTELGGIR